jgi:hypothetical protein
MSKTDVLQQLHKMIDERLFGTGPWPMDRESALKMWTMLSQMGLIELVPGTSDTWRNTPLGNELQLDILEAFLGFRDEYELCEVLEHYGLINEDDVHYLWLELEGTGQERTSTEGLQTLKEWVRRAYVAFFNPSLTSEHLPLAS